MGCDIHCAIEYRDQNYESDNANWSRLYYCVFGLPRSYKIFAKLAGVRNSEGVMPIDRPRGWPEDIDEQTKIDLEEHGDHSASWCTTKEFKRIFTDSDMVALTRFDAIEYWCVYKTMRNLEKLGYDARLVFNFDS